MEIAFEALKINQVTTMQEGTRREIFKNQSEILVKSSVNIFNKDFYTMPGCNYNPHSNNLKQLL